MRRQALQGQPLGLQPWITRSRLRRVGQSWISQREGTKRGKMTVKLIPLRSTLHTLPRPCTWSTSAKYTRMTPCRCNPSYLPGISLIRCGYCRWICRTNGLSEHQGQSGACSGRGQTDKQALDGVSRSHKEFCICSTTLHRLPHRATSFAGNCLATDGHQLPQTGFSQ